MAITDTNNPGDPATTHFCVECGAPLTGGRFCSNCGQSVVPASAGPFPRYEGAADRAAATAHGRGSASAPPTGGSPGIGRQPLLDDVEATVRLTPAAPARRGPRWHFIVPAVALVVAGAAAAAIVLLGSSDTGADQTSAYAGNVAKSFVPVDAANRRLSAALEAMTGRQRPNAARAAVARARSATSGARGALAALPAPGGSQQLATRMRQALDREDSYLRGVDLALAHPSSPAVGQLETLAGNLTSALEAVGAATTGDAQDVSGADTLTRWAGRRRHAARSSNTAAGSAPSSGVTPPASPYASGTDCGGGLHAGPNTSCDFAQNVQEAYNEAPGESASVDVYSPVTGQTYTMDCSVAGAGVTCSGGNNASVSW
jgi:hypothetical protein